MKKIKLTEVRIGNLIFPPEHHAITDDIVVINHVQKTIQTRMSNLVQVEDHPISKCTPVPISEEWLEKFGFRETGNVSGRKIFSLITRENNFKDTYGRDRKVIEIHHIPESNERLEVFAFMWGEFMEESPGRDVILEYVHQLQNLCFALTNEELVLQEIKLF